MAGLPAILNFAQTLPDQVPIIQHGLSVDLQTQQVLEVRGVLLQEIQDARLVEVRHEEVELFRVAEIVAPWEEFILVDARESY